MDKSQKKELIRIGIAALLFVAAVLADYVFHSDVAKWILSMAAYLLAGYEVLLGAAKGILRGQVLDEEFLMAVASLGAIVMNEPVEAAAVMVLYQVGEFFEDYAVDHSRRSITDLMDIQAKTATVERNGATVTVDPEEVAVGEIVVVLAGEKIPVDGVVVSGSSSVDTSALTGESVPRTVWEGEEIFSGCINQTGMLRIRSTREYEDTTVSRILDMVENASDKKARIEAFITRFARIYTPAVCGAALLLFLVPSLITGAWADWGYRALNFLVVSCPCALVISVPLSFFGGIGSASKAGILVKGSNYMESLANAGIVVFDKTGTLTRGVFRVTTVHPETMTEQELICTASKAEAASDHPIAQSIRARDEHNHTAADLTEVKEEAGMGITAVHGGNRISVGNEKLMSSLGVRPRKCPQCPHEGTVVHVAMDGGYHGHIVISDEIKKHAPQTIAELKQLGVRKTVMLTGDRQKTADAVAKRLGLDEVHAELMPRDKVDQVERLLSEKTGKETLCFVGDGINDAPVLMRADVGVAMGALGSDAAIEAADVVLMDDDPAKLVRAIRISRKTVSIARQNIIFALTVKAVILILSALGLGTLWLAIFGDVGVCMLAILNAMRAMKIR